ncbi:MAG: hypothetical protein ACE14V_15535 [bacterium]
MLGWFRINRTYAVLYPFLLCLVITVPYYWILRVLGDNQYNLMPLIIGIVCFFIYVSIFLAYRIIAQQDGISIRWILWKKQFIPWSSIKKIKFARGIIYYELKEQSHHIKVSGHLNNYMGLMELIQAYAPNVEMDIDFYRYMEQGHCEPHAFRIWSSSVYLVFTLLFLWRFFAILNGPVFDWILLSFFFFFYLVFMRIHISLLSYRHPQKSRIIAYLNLTFFPGIIILVAGMAMALESWVYLFAGLIALISLLLMFVSFTERVSSRTLIKFGGICLIFVMILLLNVLWSRQGIEIQSLVKLPSFATSLSFNNEGTAIHALTSLFRLNKARKGEMVIFKNQINIATHTISSARYNRKWNDIIGVASDKKKFAIEIGFDKKSTYELYVCDTALKSKEFLGSRIRNGDSHLITCMADIELDLRWSPDSRYFIFWEQKSIGNNTIKLVYLYDTNTKQKKKLNLDNAKLDRVWWTNQTTIRYLTYQTVTVGRKSITQYFTIWDYAINSHKSTPIYKSTRGTDDYDIYQHGKYLEIFEPNPSNWSEGTTYILNLDTFKQYIVSTTKNLMVSPQEDKLL